MKARVAALESDLAARDSEIERLRETVAESSIRLMDALERLSEGFVLLNPEQRVIIVNEHVERFFPGADLAWQPSSPLLENLELMEQAGYSFQRGEDSLSGAEAAALILADSGVDLMITGQDDAWFLFNIRPTSDGGSVLTFQDIRAIKATETALRTNSTLLQSTLEAIGQGVCAFDKEGGLLAWNHLFGDMLSLPDGLLEKGARREVVLQPLRIEPTDGDSGGPFVKLEGEEFRIGERVLEACQFPMPDGGEVTALTDITERLKAQQLLVQRATLDALTGLPNRAAGLDRLAAALSQQRRAGTGVAVLFVDLDGFKHVNDTFGHAIGDALIRAAAQRMVDCVRLSDTVARLGGDEFLVILLDQKDPEWISVVAEKIRGALTQAFTLDGNSIHVSCSIGISSFPVDGDDPSELLNKADRAMYAAKEGGKNAYRFYSDDLNSGWAKRMQIEAAFRTALENGELSLHYQPIVALSSGEAVGAEALLRWTREDGTEVPPDRFIPVIEDTNLIVPTGEWVLHQACKDAARWVRDLGAPFIVSVNVSPRQFRDENLLGTVAEVLNESDLSPECLRIEVTETLVADSVGNVLSIMRALNELGVNLSMDDFGTGYSALRYVKDFPFKSLKIDKSFIAGALDSEEDAAITRTVIGMANSLNLSVIAEGVETEAQLAFLREHSCGYAQGYLFGRPLPEPEFRANLPILGKPKAVAAR